MCRKTQRRFWKVAMHLADRLAQRSAPSPPPLPTSAWVRLLRLTHLQAKAQQQGWLLAGDRMTRQITNLRQEILDLLARISHAVSTMEPRASVADLFADLQQLAAEFPQINLDLKEQFISVTTDPIILEGIELGPFEIQLFHESLTQSQPEFCVVALEPAPATVNDEVTHPHVQDNQLCCGEGQSAINAALRQGRLGDFFTLVNLLLHTYNSGSPYVPLSDWHGVLCHDCGEREAPDDMSDCSRCDVSLCGHCVLNCNGCDEPLCHGCSESCSGCDDRCCSGCLEPCVGCRELFCSMCLDENERCDSCATLPETLPSETPLQSDRLGQTAVPA